MKRTSIRFGTWLAVLLVAIPLATPPAAVAARGGGGGGGGGGMGVTITAAYVAGANGLDPADASWNQASAVTVTLNRFIDYVASGGGDMCMGTSVNRPVTVRAAHNGADIFFRFEWADATADTMTDDTPKFADAFAMEIPYSGGNAPIAMGSQTNPVNIAFWRADLAQPQNIVAGGIGTPQPSPDAQNLSHYQNWGNGAWTVIVKRPLTGASVNQVTFARGASYSITFANWNGSDANRNGRKAIAMGWNTLSIQ
ncbi:MAG: hypothetical protein A2150_02695 [Candidatus Muproteobacteria bacterium RBG_16_64_11]|uniref:Cytochrome c-552/DMSO reductase-like haem-binding domain-containing protein n=1 Tax=Candidatus Muproteobacteria bacterium RBG_16_64_11 TaxID=1817758 RepID=A0A1F6TIE6_9PROT|nr:MAG: hypothetical protein A2150_02695 [Candidatus Muproteobacteria bacterium RBG_16_64_11]